MDANQTRPADPPWPSGGLGHRIVGVVLLAALGTAIVVGGAALYSVFAPLRDRIEEMSARVLAGSAEELVEVLDAVRGEIESVAGQPRWQRVILAASAKNKRTDREIEAVSKLLIEALSGVSTLSALLVLDADGEVVVAAGSRSPLGGLLAQLETKNVLESDLMERLETRELQRELAGVETPTIRTVDTGVGFQVVLAAHPLRGRGGARVATLVGIVDRERLEGPLPADLLGEGANVLVLDGRGGLVAAHSDSDDPGSLAVAPHAALSLRFGWSRERGGVATYSRPLGSLDWRLVAEQPIHQAFAPLLIMLPALLTTAGMAMLGFSLLAAHLARRIVHPIREVHRGLAAIKQGDPSVEVALEQAPGETRELVRGFNQMAQRLSERHREFEESQRALKDQNRSFQDKYQSASELSVTDPLTQLHNRRFFENQLQCEVKRMGRSKEGLCLLILDIDDFKRMNDTFGHAAGDEFLKQVATIMKENVRATDLVARFGGEEFVVVATSTDLQGAEVLAGKIRTAIAEASFIVDDTMRPRQATVSIGVAAYKGSQTGMFNAADAALYQAKASGKNCVIVASS